jgi:hypothetical protein
MFALTLALALAAADDAIPDAAKERYAAATAKLAAHDWLSATALLNALASDFPRMPEVFASRCAAQLGQRQYGTAFADCQYALRLKKLPTAVYGIAVAEDGLGRYGDAMAHYREYVALPNAAEDLKAQASARITALGPYAASAPSQPVCDKNVGEDDEEGIYLPARAIDACGTQYFEGSLSQVYKAAEDAARSLGFGVTVSRPERGFFITDRFAIDEKAFATGRGSATFVMSARQYEVRVEPMPDGRFRVRAQPHAFENGNDVSYSRIWRLDGQWGEKPRWRRLFARMHDLL